SLIRNAKAIRKYSAAAYTGRYEFETISVSSPFEHVLHVEINRPDVSNAMNKDMLHELLECFSRVQDDQHCRAVVISGTGKHFSAGLDFNDMKEMVNKLSSKGGSDEMSQMDAARKAKFIRSMILMFQESFTSLEKCGKPVICAINGACISAGLAIATAADIRYCSQDAFFQLKEVDVGMASDMGQLQRLPLVIGNESLMNELVFTARKMPANEAKEMGLVSKVFGDGETTKQAAIEMARLIASKSPVAVQGSKNCLKHCRDLSVADGLKYVANWNMVMLQSIDFTRSLTIQSAKGDEIPVYSDL
ncbi:Delta(3:5)-Delta(2:4)-dienoyl-CoA isomerase-like protein, partial [Leptotrombidium deliense]